MYAASMDQPDHLSVPNSARGSARGRSYEDRRATPRARRMDKDEYKELLEVKVAEARKKC